MRLDLTCKNGLEIVQGSDYGPVVMCLREQVRDEYTITVASVGSVGDTSLITLFGVLSDAPELEVSAAVSTATGDTVDDIASRLVAAIEAKHVSVINDKGEVVVQPITDHARVSSDGPVITIAALSKMVFVSPVVSSTVPGNLAITTHEPDVRIDLTGATITAQLKADDDASSELLDTWTLANVFEIRAPATSGRFSMTIPASVSAAYDFDRAWWQCEIERPPSEHKRWFDGVVELDRSVM